MFFTDVMLSWYRSQLPAGIGALACFVSVSENEPLPEVLELELHLVGDAAVGIVDAHPVEHLVVDHEDERRIRRRDERRQVVDVAHLDRLHRRLRHLRLRVHGEVERVVGVVERLAEVRLLRQREESSSPSYISHGHSHCGSSAHGGATSVMLVPPRGSRRPSCRPPSRRTARCARGSASPTPETTWHPDAG